METEVKASVANGEIGEVVGFTNGKVFVRIPSQNIVVAVPYFRQKGKPNAEEADDEGDSKETSDTGCDMDLGFSSSAHRSQGAQFDYVIVALDEYPGAVGPRGICKREWLYTAISRAKIGCILVGLRSTALAMIAETALDKRKTFLAELIKKYREEDQHWQKNTLEGTCSTVTTAESTPSTPKKPARLNWMATGAFKVTSPMT